MNPSVRAAAQPLLQAAPHRGRGTEEMESPSMWSYGTRLKARLKDTFLESLARKERQGMQTSVARKPKTPDWG